MMSQLERIKVFDLINAIDRNLILKDSGEIWVPYDKIRNEVEDMRQHVERRGYVQSKNS